MQPKETAKCAELRARRYDWVGFALVSAASIAAMAACVKIAAVELPRSEIVFFRNFIGLVLLLPLAWQRSVSFKTDRLGLHLIRGAAGTAAMYLYFYAITYLSLADAVLLNYTSPLFICFFAFALLGERLTWKRKTAVFLGFAGVAFLFHPSSAIASIAGLLGLMSGMMAGLAQISVKGLSSSEPGLRIVMMFALFGACFSVVPMLFDFRFPDARMWLYLIAIGTLGNMGQLSMARAYLLAPASQVSPLGYSGLVFAGLIGFVFWKEAPDAWMLVGTIFITGAGILVAREPTQPVRLSPPSGSLFK
jgi:drug/metabolite transporter (DMT)-like permease